MKIIEARDGFVKIETEKNPKISSFLEIKGLEKRYIAQVVKVKDNGAGYTAYAKILFIYDGSLIKYDKTLPSVTSEVSEFSFEIINNYFDCKNPVVVGKFLENGNDILLGAETFNKPFLISVDTPEIINIIVTNLAKQFKQKKKIVVIDMLGIINGNKYVAGRDFKLPLNKDSLEFLYEDCLKDATSESKDMIKEIFRDLANYSEEVPFLPFSALKSIVDDMVEKSHVFKLLVLKNKLEKFDKAGYFASGKIEADNLNKVLLSENAVIDLSKIEPLFQNRYLKLVYATLCQLNDSFQVFLIASNVISKKNIQSFLFPEDKINTIFVSHSKFKYLSELKSFFKNFIIENTYTNNEVFKLYSFFLNSINSKHYLIVGEGTNYIPLISKVEKYDVNLTSVLTDIVANEIINSEYDLNIPDSDAVLSDVNITEPKIDESVEETSIQEMPTDKDAKDNDETVELDSVVNNDNNVEDSGIDELPENIEEPVLNEEEKEEYHTIADDTTSVEISASLDSMIEETVLSEIPEQDKYSNEIINEDNVVKIEQAEDNNLNDNGEVINSDVDTDNNQVNDADNKDNTDNDLLDAGDEEISIPSELTEEYNEVKDLDKEPNDLNQQEESVQREYTEPEAMPLNNDDEMQLDEIIELDASEINDDDILVDLTDDALPELKTELTPDELDREITEDVDRVFTTMRDESISDSDLDFIDELNEGVLDEENSLEQDIFESGDADTLEALSDDEDDNGFLEPLQEISDSAEPQEEREVLEKRDTTTPIVPVYDAEIPEEDKIMSDYVEQGDNVIHAKYGTGVVEKVIKYGNKTLHSINFDNVGRRLLDLEITEVKKA